MTATIPWSLGKTQGILSIQSFFSKICRENECEISKLRVNSLRKQSREIFLSAQGINSRGRDSQGISRETDPRAPTHPIASKRQFDMDENIINYFVRFVRGHAWLLQTGRAVGARVEPRIKSADVHDETEAQRLILGAALKANLGGCRQRAPYPLRPPGKNGEGKTGADGVL
jgi:hypothetical protein